MDRSSDPAGSSSGPVVQKGADGFCSVRGAFWRAIDPLHRGDALAGSRSAGRFSRADEPTLYLSSSREGVAAAMIAHAASRARGLEVVGFDVAASNIVDLRDAPAAASLGINPRHAAVDWQADVAAGRTPPSWRVRDALVAAGAHGLIDPSRKRPGLWHLTLFGWNAPGLPTVRAHTSRRA